MLHDVAIFLAAAVIAVPAARALGLGSVIGYLVAGLAIGPWGFALVTDVDSILHFSEFGVVLLLFVIGLELQPERFWRLRGAVFGSGGAQVLLTSVVLGGIAMACGVGPGASLIAGFGLAMSSTAFVLQLLDERDELATREGLLAFAILLFQDLAVVPFLALLPLMAGNGAAQALELMPVLKALGVIVVVVAAGRYGLRPVLRRVARANVPEIFTAAALLVVVATALLMEGVGMSMSLGAFLAGVMLAESEFRHELQAAIEPFKGLLLGLFFIAVGMSVNQGVLIHEPWLVLGLVAGLVLVKGAILYAIGRAAQLPADGSRALAASVSQGGEFAFVLFALATTAGLLDREMHDRLTVVVTVSMALSPLLYAWQARFRQPVQGPPYDAIDGPAAPVIIAGFGPFGQVVGRVLRVKKIPFTVLEKNPEQVDFVRRFGSKIYYGDAARLDLLRAAHAAQAKVLVISISRVETSLRIAEAARQHFPKLRVFAAANDRNHALRLMDLGVKDVIRRNYFSSLEMSRRLLMVMGDDEARARRAIDTFHQHDEATLLKQQAMLRDESSQIQSAQDAARELETLFETDKGER